MKERLNTLVSKPMSKPVSKHRKVLWNVFDVTSTYRDYRTIQHASATYEQTKKELSYSHPKGIVQQDRIHTLPLKIKI